MPSPGFGALFSTPREAGFAPPRGPPGRSVVEFLDDDPEVGHRVSMAALVGAGPLAHEVAPAVLPAPGTWGVPAAERALRAMMIKGHENVRGMGGRRGGSEVLEVRPPFPRLYRSAT
jgi:hypothetical protein